MIMDFDCMFRGLNSWASDATIVIYWTAVFNDSSERQLLLDISSHWEKMKQAYALGSYWLDSAVYLVASHIFQVDQLMPANYHPISPQASSPWPPPGSMDLTVDMINLPSGSFC